MYMTYAQTGHSGPVLRKGRMIKSSVSAKNVADRLRRQGVKFYIVHYESGRVVHDNILDVNSQLVGD